MTVIVQKIYDKPFGFVKVNGQPFLYISENGTRGEHSGPEKHIVNHWGACMNFQIFDGYTNNLCDLNSQIYVFQTLKRQEKGQHLWGRNSGCVGNSMSCMYKNAKPTDKLIEALAILNAEQCAWYHLDPEGTVILPKKKRISFNQLITVPGQITAPVVSDHRYFAGVDQYSQERWDIGDYMPIVLKRTIEIFKELKAGKRTFIFKDIL
jgi:hypothetical protein